MPKTPPAAIDAEDLYQAVLKLKNLDEVRRFLRDLMTASEIREFSKRWQAARMLDMGIPYTNIVRATGLSSTTIARVHRWLTKGRGGYRLMIDRIT